MRDFPTKFTVYTEHNYKKIPQINFLNGSQLEALEVISQVLPFRVNNYVLELINWNDIPSDPVFQMVFPQRKMLNEEYYLALLNLIRKSDKVALSDLVAKIHLTLNPHPAGQMSHNVPFSENVKLEGVQHKYAETLLYFPGSGQTCHSYCSFCFRWPQFIANKKFKFSSNTPEALPEYIQKNPAITDILITGGDPLIASTQKISNYLLEFLSEPYAQITTIRIGTKALSYWPQRFVTDADAGSLLKLFELIIKKGKHLSIMAHYNHAQELSTGIAQQAISRVRSTGAIIRAQAPILAHINDSPEAWIDLWKQQVRFGIIPYYMFVERDTGPYEYFKLPLVRALEIYKSAYKQVSGLARTVRGPVMSTFPGKLLLEDIVSINHKKYFAFKYLQTRNYEHAEKLFFKEYDAEVSWYEDLSACVTQDINPASFDLVGAL